eukprot:14515638-Ditylum_brightwellii.AAC.1
MLSDDEFYRELTSVVEYLRHQQNLISKMKITCPKVVDTCWESMTSVSHWLKTNRVNMYTHLESKNPLCQPLPKWWIYIMILGPFSRRATIAFKQLQGHEVTVSMQQQHFDSVQLYYMESMSTEGPFVYGSDDAAALENSGEW